MNRYTKSDFLWQFTEQTVEKLKEILFQTVMQSVGVTIFMEYVTLKTFNQFPLQTGLFLAAYELSDRLRT